MVQGFLGAFRIQRSAVLSEISKPSIFKSPSTCGEAAVLTRPGYSDLSFAETEKADEVFSNQLDA
jgi:hypothetical protein